MKYIRMAAIALMAVLISCAAVFGADTIELPFDYFAGRWTPGHYLHGNYLLQKDRYPRYSWSYLLTSDPFRFSVDRFETNLFYKYQNHEFLSAPMSLDYRPFDHWQLGVHGLVYRYINRNNESDVADPEYSAFRSKRLTFNVTSYWQRHTDMAVTDRAAPYAYRVQPILTKGNVTISNKWAFLLHHYRRSSKRYFRYEVAWSNPEDSTVEWVIQEQHDYREYNRSETGWNLHNNILWGITDDVNVGANAIVNGEYSENFLYAASQLSRDYSSGVSSDFYDFNRDYEIRSRHDLELRLSFAACGLAPLFIAGSAFQNYDYRKTDQSFYRGDSTGLIHSSRRVKRKKLMRDSNGFSLSLDYLDHGDFDESILLDDYSDFYRGMLFDGQSQISVAFDYVSDFYYFPYDHSSFDISLARGVSNRAEIGSAITYNWTERAFVGRPPTSEDISVRFMLRYRSYDYEPGTGPGWHRDTRFDWLYGPTLAAGQTYLSFTLRPYGARSGSPAYRNFMAFDLTRRDPVDWLETDLQVGLGRGFSVTADDLLQWDISRGVILRNSYSLQLEGRIQQRFLLTAGFSQTFTNHIDKKDTFSDPKFEINLHGLL